MAQHDYNIANASGATVRADLNNVLSAIMSLNSGGTAPTTTAAYMPWADTATGLLKIRNAANSAWITVGTLASANLGLVVAPTTGGTTADQVLSTNGSGVQSWVDRMRLVRDTAKASTSGATVPFTGIPSWARRITLSLQGVSTSGTAGLQAQVGTSSGTVATGYLSASSSSTPTTSNSTTGFLMTPADIVAGAVMHGNITLVNMTGNVWSATSTIARSDAAYVANSAGTISLAGTLDRILLTTTGADTFDLGTVNIVYEG